MKVISVIIVEYKSVGLVEAAVASLRPLADHFDMETIVVSNSRYNPAERKRFSASLPDTTFIFNDENFGFGRANNQAMRQARGRYLLLLNPDAMLTGTSLADAVQFMDQNPRAGIIGPAIRDSAGTVQDSCRQFMTLRRFFERNVQRALGRASGSVPDYGDCSSRRMVDWVSGACMLVRRQAVDEVGMMDERFFMYIEDMDWCRRFWEAGWQVWYEPAWTVEHNARRTSTSAFRLTNRLMWIHLASYVKYFLKWMGKPLVRSSSAG